MKIKKLYIVSGIVLALVAALLIAFFILSAPTEPEPEASAENTDLYNALVINGIEDAVVDITGERALVRYNLPDFMNKTTAVYYILGAAAAVAPEAEKIIIQTYQNFEPVDEITIDTKEVLSFAEGKISEEEFLRKIS